MESFQKRLNVKDTRPLLSFAGVYFIFLFLAKHTVKVMLIAFKSPRSHLFMLKKEEDVGSNVYNNKLCCILESVSHILDFISASCGDMQLSRFAFQSVGEEEGKPLIYIWSLAPLQIVPPKDS